MERLRRATQLVLSLQAFRLEHGELPERLEDLVGDFLEQIPDEFVIYTK